ncbi:MAG: hypothetical protein HY597_04275 [Candidatus Omnitrophica bacterium]|nr:hypothetical protein [Candidatus Omnitrophota bacterium]
MNQRGQSLAEYALLLALVLGALTGMAVYLQRGIQMNVRLHADHVLAYAGAEKTQERGILSSGNTLAEHDVRDWQWGASRRQALGGIAAYEMTQDEVTYTTGFEQFTQLEGPPAEGGKAEGDTR